ncbi:MAG: type II secretion system protein GspM [Hyphomonas sp.]
MMALWRQRTSREKLLLLLAAGLVAAALIVQVLVIPSLSARDQAAVSVREAENTLTRLERIKTSGAAYVPVMPASPSEDSAARAARLATDTGLVVKAAPTSTLPLHFTFEPAEPTRVFTWIEEAENVLGLTVESAEITSAGPDLINATIIFAGAPQP